jgi:Dolichyl-phosphate-mannose-protein mannosyltransferase
MRKVSIIVELLRSQPQLLFWAAALVQAALWFLVPALFYASPPGELPYTLAIGHEYQLGTYLGPPLAYWLTELTFVLAGGSVIGIYLLAQICVVVTYWAVFALGRAIVGLQHAAIATLLMVGIATFGLTPDFGPPVVAMALTALIFLHLWRAVGEGARKAWFFLAIEMGLLLLTSYSGLIVVVLVVLFIASTARGRATLDRAEPWMAGVVLVMVLFPHLIWLDIGGEAIGLTVQGLHGAEAADGNLFGWTRLVAVLLATHAGLAVLVALATAWHMREADDVVVFRRPAVAPFARRFLYYFALAPGIVATLLAAVFGLRSPVGGTAPYVVLSGLAVVMAAGDAIAFHRQRVVGVVWTTLLVLPPAGAVAAILVLPWVVAVDLAVVQPAGAMGRFFSESFERRTGQKLAIVAGDLHTAALVALGSPSRPSLFLDATPQYSPWLTAEEVRSRGAVVVWPTTSTAGPPPEQIKQDFPDLVAEVPRAFERLVQGRLALLRIGWGVVRPQGAPAQPR